MDIQKSLLLMVVFFGMAIGTYFVISPYEQCVREQTARFGSVDTAGMEGLQKDVVKALCAKTTNW